MLAEVELLEEVERVYLEQTDLRKLALEAARTEAAGVLSIGSIGLYRLYRNSGACKLVLTGTSVTLTSRFVQVHRKSVGGR
jgi:hypothetical protein